MAKHKPYLPELSSFFEEEVAMRTHLEEDGKPSHVSMGCVKLAYRTNFLWGFREDLNLVLGLDRICWTGYIE
jgi:hypothetical protein